MHYGCLRHSSQGSSLGGGTNSWSEAWMLCIGLMKIQVKRPGKGIANKKKNTQIIWDQLEKNISGYMYAFVCLLSCILSSGSILFPKNMNLQLRDDGSFDGWEREQNC